MFPFGERDPLRAIPPSRHPFQVLTLVAFGFSGLRTIATETAPGTITEGLPQWAVILWGALCFVGGLLAVASAWWPDRIMGLLIEKTGLQAVAGACGVYGVTVVTTYRGEDGNLLSALMLAVTVACFWRARHVQIEIDTLRYWQDLLRGARG